LLVIGFSLLLLANCKKDKKNDPAPVTPVISNSFTATIDGVSYNGNDMFYGTHSGDKYVLFSKGGDQSVSLCFPDTVKTSSYPLANNYFSCYAQYSTSPYDNYMSTSGTLSFTVIDIGAGKMKGTFNCVVTKVSKTGSTVNITNGAFNLGVI